METTSFQAEKYLLSRCNLKDASPDAECSFLLLQLKPAQTTLAISENDGIGSVPNKVSWHGWEDLGGKFTITFGRSKKYKR